MRAGAPTPSALRLVAVHSPMSSSQESDSSPTEDREPWRVTALLLVPITAFAGYLRWHDLGVPSLWLDEILHLRVTEALDWTQPWLFLLGMRETGGYAENGPLYYALQALGQVVAPGDLGVRIGPALVGTLSVPLFGLAVGAFVPKKHRTILVLSAALALAVSPLHVFYSREGRPYYLLMGLAIALIYCLARAARPVALRRACVVAITLLCLLGAYVGIHALPLMASAAVVAGLMVLPTLGPASASRDDQEPENLERRGLVRTNLLILLASLTAALLLCGALYLTRSQQNLPTLELREVQKDITEAPTFESPLSGESLKRFASSMTTAGIPSFHVGERAGLLFFLALVGLLSVLIRPRTRYEDGASRWQLALIALGMFVLPAALSVAALVSTGRWYHIRYTSTAQPAFLLLVCLGVVALAALGEHIAHRVLPRRRPKGLRYLAALAGIGVVVQPNYGPALAHPHARLDWRAIAEFVDDMVLPDEPILVSTDWAIVCLGHYLEQRDRQVEFIKIWERADLGQDVLDERPRGWLLSAGVRGSDNARTWMHNFVPIWKQSAEQFSLFYFPNLLDLFATRLSGEKGRFFEERFASAGQLLDFGHAVWPMQGIGWSFVERSPGLNMQWAVGREARVALPIGEPRTVIVETRVRPFIYPGSAESPDQMIDFWLGDQFIERVALEPEWNQIQIRIPADVWAREHDVLRLFFAKTERPADVIEGSTDQRALAAAFDWIRIIEIDPEPGSSG